MTKILFADDNENTLNLMGQVAKLLGYQAVLAKNGREALALIRQDQPNLIFLDLLLPDLDGISLLRKIKEDNEIRDIPVVILSAGATLDDATLCRDNGAVEYILKPVPIQVLQDTIQKYSLVSE